MNIALFQPDMAGNAAAAIRLAVCFGLPISIIEPTGFVFDAKRLRRVGMDYLDRAEIFRWPSFQAFDTARRQESRRLVLLTTKGAIAHHEARFSTNDILLAGRESGGVPDDVHEAADLRVRLPMAAGARSLNVVAALSMVLGEALRQTGAFASLDGKAEIEDQNGLTLG